MPIDLSVLGRRINPQKTVLVFGAGASIPSGAPSTPELINRLAEKFRIPNGDSLSLVDLATVIEAKQSRRDMIDFLCEQFDGLQPARGLNTLPEFDWAGLYTTNYDELVEKSFARSGKALNVFASNFDFTTSFDPLVTPLYKLHGTLKSDVSLGHQHRMIISGHDYDLTSEYRELLFAKFAEQLFTHNAIVIGQSLDDPDLKAVVDEAVRVKRQCGAPGQIVICAYTQNDNQAIIYEARGLEVCFAGIDEFFDEIAKKIDSERLLPGISNDPLDRARDVYPSTTSVADARANETGNLARMFSGGSGNYADIMRGWTFERDFTDRLETQLASENGERVAYVLGPAGCGKSTGVRKALTRLCDRGIDCWEHSKDFGLKANSWVAIDDELRRRKQIGVLFLDDAHENLHGANALIDSITKNEVAALKVVLVSSKPQWNPRLKTPAIFSFGRGYEVSKLTDREISSLLDLLDSNNEIARLVERNFLGFSRAERQRRLSERCQADMFVCLKNIFATEAFDEIILREFAELSVDYQDAYRRIAGMEAAGIRVHRQFVLRTVNIAANQVERFLEDLEGIIQERTINERDGVFAWQVRHNVIAEIIARYKITSEDEFYQLLENAIDHLNPTYDIELRSMDDICSPKAGFGRIPNKQRQNVLLRKMISLAPRRRVPRHRLITNLIALHDFENARTEIRLFENEMRVDGPVQRYKVKLLLERSRHSKGILPEDRSAMIKEAAAMAEAGIQQFRDDKNMYDIYLQAGVALVRNDNDRSIFEQAMNAAKSAYDRILDPELSRTLTKFERISHQF